MHVHVHEEYIFYLLDLSDCVKIITANKQKKYIKLRLELQSIIIINSNHEVLSVITDAMITAF